MTVRIEYMENFSPSCERNKQAIYQQLAAYLPQSYSIFEVGSLSGQHALHFTGLRPDILWQCSDIEDNLPALATNIRHYGGESLLPPVVCDLINQDSWQHSPVDGLYTANTLHIVAPQLVENFFTVANKLVKSKGKLFIYGPFKYNGHYTSASNADFQLWLLERDPNSGIRDFEWVNALATEARFSLLNDIAMPANNQLLVFQRD
ncbi:DUF938 domain-containing protein [Thalassotalea mangrovi]|uniref:DUF938 domain-containing protein n=1 Tax=Thalassotalea mangrovi TaxID=2572245 RepID=A0A4U1B8M0_9GAMM|nr:DUF938 domain-containing protein [Thalassotalea mangrovi]TKB46306.1 DUF938 domain-containing protein [Thalassotalea mangrovi]